MTTIPLFEKKILSLFSSHTPRLNLLEKKYVVKRLHGSTYWFQKLHSFHPEVQLRRRDGEKLRLILGLGRSGTTWLARVLASSPTPLRFFEEPLFHMKPELCFNEGSDHTAIDYNPPQQVIERLLLAYGLLGVKNFDWDRLGIKKFLIRDDTGFQACLVKEVHGLMACEQIVDHLQCPILFIIRDPIRVVDSLIHAQSFDSVYLDAESRQLPLNKRFLKTFFPVNFQEITDTYSWISNIRFHRKKIILRKVLTAGVLTEYFKLISKRFRNTSLITYEQLCLNPWVFFPQLAEFLKIVWDHTSEIQLQESMRKNSTSHDPYSIFQDTKMQINRTLAVLSNEEKKAGESILRECGLRYRRVY